MAETFPGRIDKLEIGTTPGTNVDITNVVLLNWERSHDVRPRLVANTKIPVGWQQPHSWIIGSFSLLSNQYTALYNTDVVAATAGIQPALDMDGDSNIIDFLQVTYRDQANGINRTKFTGAIIYRWTKELLNYDDSVWIYHFLAYYADDNPT